MRSNNSAVSAQNNELSQGKSVNQEDIAATNLITSEINNHSQNVTNYASARLQQGGLTKEEATGTIDKLISAGSEAEATDIANKAVQISKDRAGQQSASNTSSAQAASAGNGAPSMGQAATEIDRTSLAPTNLALNQPPNPEGLLKLTA